MTEDTEDEFDVVTTAPGTLGPQGIVPVGTRTTVPSRMFSKHWMKPATQASGKKIAAYLEAKEASEQGS